VKVIEYQDSLGAPSSREALDPLKCSKQFKLVSGQRSVGSGHQVEYFVQVVNQAKQKINLCFTHFNVISHPLVDWQFKNSSGKSLELEPRLPEIYSGIGQAPLHKVISLDSDSALEFVYRVRLSATAPADSPERQIHTVTWTMILGSEYLKGDIKK
jgi:hypothetical protein